MRAALASAGERRAFGDRARAVLHARQARWRRYAARRCAAAADTWWPASRLRARLPCRRQHRTHCRRATLRTEIAFRGGLRRIHTNRSCFVTSGRAARDPASRTHRVTICAGMPGRGLVRAFPRKTAEASPRRRAVDRGDTGFRHTFHRQSMKRFGRHREHRVNGGR